MEPPLCKNSSPNELDTRSFSSEFSRIVRMGPAPPHLTNTSHNCQFRLYAWTATRPSQYLGGCSWFLRCYVFADEQAETGDVDSRWLRKFVLLRMLRVCLWHASGTGAIEANPAFDTKSR